MPSLKNNAIAFAGLFAFAQAQQVMNNNQAGAQKIFELAAAIPADAAGQKTKCDTLEGNLVESNCFTFAGEAWTSAGVETTADACTGGCAAWQVCVDDAEICEAGEPSGIGMIIAIVAGLLCAIVAAILAYCLCCNKKDDDFARQ